MLITTASDFRKDIKGYFDKVIEGSETLIINRGKDSGIVVISLDEYNSLNETAYLNSTTANTKRLNEGINELKNGKGKTKKLIEK
jgi:antitoxin YefM